MSAATLIRNGRVITAGDDFIADVLVVNGRIAAIADTLPAGPGAIVHDATGLYVLPGAVDVHTHLDSATPTASTVDDFAVGTRAAAFGGTTTVVDYCTPAAGAGIRTTWCSKRSPSGISTSTSARRIQDES